MNTSEQKEFQAWVKDYGIQIGSSHIAILSRYLSELLKWNKVMNLVGLSSRQRILSELLFDSLIPLPYLPNKGNYLDLGSGGGFPGIPIKACKPGLRLILIEAISKKVSFLKQVIRLLKLTDITVLNGRIEDNANLLNPNGYDLITARAVSSLDQIILWCAPLLSQEGILITFQGSHLDQILEDSQDIIKEQDLILLKTVSYTLPGKKAPRRHLLIFKKTGVVSNVS